MPVFGKDKGKNKSVGDELGKLEGKLDDALLKLNDPKSMLNTVKERCCHKNKIDILVTNIKDVKNAIMYLNTVKSNIEGNICVLMESHSYPGYGDDTPEIEACKKELSEIYRDFDMRELDSLIENLRAIKDRDYTQLKTLLLDCLTNELTGDTWRW